MIIELEYGINARCIQCVRVVGKEHERREPGGPNGVALGYRLGRVANGVKLIRNFTNFRGQLRHLGNTAGVVRDWAERIQCNDNTRHRKHGCRCDSDVVKTA